MSADNEDLCLDDGDPLEFMHAHNASVLRLMLPENRGETSTQGLPCIETAYGEGFQIYLSVEYPGNLSVSDSESWIVTRVIPFLRYATYVSIGNEEELKGVSDPAQYKLVWDATAPVLERLHPGIKLAFGEGSPGSWGWIQQAWSAYGTTPADASGISLHAYDANGDAGINAVGHLAALAIAADVPVWCSEMAPDTLLTLSWITPEPLSTYEAHVQTMLAQYPFVRMIDYYVWPAFGAN